MRHLLCRRPVSKGSVAEISLGEGGELCPHLPGFSQGRYSLGLGLFWSWSFCWKLASPPKVGSDLSAPLHPELISGLQPARIPNKYHPLRQLLRLAL